MAKGDAPPRRRLVASDSEDEAPPAPPAPDPPPDPDSDASPEVNWASVAQRLRYVVPAPPDPSADLDPDAHALITDALSELRALDFVARDPAEVAAKLVEHDVLDAVFALLRDAPPPASSDDADPASDDASDDKENAAAAAASTAPDPTPEALKRARRIAMLRAKHAAVTLPALRALAHLLGAPGPIRRDVGSALLRVRTVFAHLDPRRGDPSNAVLEAALRALASVAVSSASAASRIALMCAGKDEAFPDGARWFVDRFAAFEPGKRRNAAAPSARVGAKAARLATLLLKTPANRAAMFGAWSEGAAAEDLEDSADAEPEPSAEASKSSSSSSSSGAARAARPSPWRIASQKHATPGCTLRTTATGTNPGARAFALSARLAAASASDGSARAVASDAALQSTVPIAAEVRVGTPGQCRSRNSATAAETSPPGETRSATTSHDEEAGARL